MPFAPLLRCAALVIASLALNAQELVTLTVADDIGVPRAGEAVTSGIPLPQGLLAADASLQLSAGGKRIPAGFTVINRWPDGSARWVLLDTVLDVPANGSVTLSLDQTAARPLRGTLAVDDGAEQISVDTGAAQFVVRKSGFRLFESLSVDGEQILAAMPEGLSMTIGDDEYLFSDDQSTVIVEDQSDMRVVLLATGKTVRQGGTDRFDYEVRIAAYRGRAELKVTVSVLKKYGKRRHATHLTDLSLGLKLAQADGDLAFALGTDGDAATGQLSGDQHAVVHASSSTSFTLGGAAEGSGNPKKSKPTTLGWGDLRGRSGGVAAGVHRFWQTFPKAIEATGDGRLFVRLYPRQQQEGVDLYTGTARTHEVLIVPHRGKPSVAELQNRFAAFQSPLRAFPSSQWLCRSGGLGILAEADPELYGEAAEPIGKATQTLDEIVTTLITDHRDHWRKRGVTMDAYGWMAWGDTLHWVWQKVPEPKGSPWTIVWDSNYYDKPHMLLMHFARTGRREAFDFFMDASWHLMDIGVVHYDPHSCPQGGGSRRCPSTNHYGFDPPEHKDIVVNAFDHHKSESLFERYYLTGDRRALRTALDLANFALSQKAQDRGSRKAGHQINSLVAAWHFDHDQKWLDKAREVVDANMARQEQFDGGFRNRPNFHQGLLAEGFCEYYLASGDQDVLDAIKHQCDFFTAKGKYEPNQTPAFTLVFWKTGERKYLDEGMKHLVSRTPGHLGKDTPMFLRGLGKAAGYVARGLGTIE